MLAGATDCRRSRKWGCRGRRWDLNPGAAATEREEYVVLEERRGPRGFGVLLFAMRLRQQERLCWEEKGRKDSCWWAVRRCHMALD